MSFSLSERMIVLFLIACDDNLNALFQIALDHHIASLSYRAQRRLIDDVGQLRTGSACRRTCHRAEVEVGIVLDLLGVHAAGCPRVL